MSRRRLAINLVSNTLSFLVSFFVGFILTPYITKHVGKDAYGFIGLALNLTSYMGVAVLAVNSMAGRFIAIHYHRQDYGKSNAYYSSVLLVNLLIVLLLVVPCGLVVLFVQDIFHVPDRLVTDVQALFAFVFAWFLISLVSSSFSVATFIANRLDLSSLRSIGASLIRLVSVGALFFFFKPAVFYVGISFALMALFEVAVNYKLIRLLTPKLVVKLSDFKKACLKELFAAGVWNSLNSVGNILSKGLDLLIVNLYLGPLAMGTLAIAKTLPNLISSLIGAMASAFGPQFTQTVALEDKVRLKQQVEQSIKVLGLLANIPLVILVTLGASFYHLWLPTEDGRLLQVLSVVCVLDLVITGSLDGMFLLFNAYNKIKVPSLVYLANGLSSTLVVLAWMHFSGGKEVGLYVVAGTSTVFYIVAALTFLPIYSAKCLGLRFTAFYPSISKNLFSFLMSCLAAHAVVRWFGQPGWFALVGLGFTVSLVALGVNGTIVFGIKPMARMVSTIYLKVNWRDKWL